MRSELALLAGQYAAAIEGYIAHRSEEALSLAYELGRKALADGIGVVDMAMLHHRALGTLLNEPASDSDERTERAAEFFSESLSAFEMSLRGYREANANLQVVNTTLQEAKAALETANRDLEESVRQRSGRLGETETELARTRSFLDLVIENIPGMIAVKSARDHRYILFNRSAEEVLGYDRSEMIGKTDHEVFPKEQADFFVAMDNEVLHSGRLQLIPEQAISTRDQQIRYWRVKKLPIFGNNGEPDYILAMAEDITERRTIEAQLAHAQKMEAIGQLTGGMAHDFNNLLGVIIGNLDVLLGLRKSDADVMELAGEALEAAVRGADLTRRLLAFARRQPLRPERVEVNERVKEIAHLLGRTLGERVALTLELAPDVWPITADPAQLEAAITNLATNARDAMPKGGRLIIATGNRQLDAEYAAQHPEVVPGDYAMIEVTDTGTGIPPEILGHIFEPFFTTKDRDHGTGLGLSMVFGYIKQSGGHINVYSEVNVGTTFRLYLPRSPKAPAASTEVKAEQILQGHGETVLVVEDNVGLRRIVVRQLRDLGYGVLEAGNAAAAQTLLDQQSADLLLTDIVMPGEMDGFELARIALSRWPAMRVVLTSGFPQAKINGDIGAAAPAARLLSKPYRKEELARTLREVLDS
jgi:PAS domain S-box-containing protein